MTHGYEDEPVEQSLLDLINAVQADLETELGITTTSSEESFNDPELFNEENNGDMSYIAKFMDFSGGVITIDNIDHSEDV